MKLDNYFLKYDLQYDPGTVKRLKSLAELFDIEPDNPRAALDLLEMGKRAKIVDEDEFQSDYNRIFPHYLKECKRIQHEEWLRKEREEDEEREKMRVEEGKRMDEEMERRWREENGE